MTRGKTLRYNKKPSKKTYFSKGGAPPQDYNVLQNTYAANIEAKKTLFDSVQKEGSHLYDYETGIKNTESLPYTSSIPVFVQNFITLIETAFSDKQQAIQTALTKYGEEYTSYFVLILVEIQNIINEATGILKFVSAVNQEFEAKQVHIHLIESRIALLESKKLYLNTINGSFLEAMKRVDSILHILQNESTTKQQIQQSNLAELEAKKTEFEASISLVNRLPPDGFVSQAETPFLQGCPLGTVLETNMCKYYNNTDLIESVPVQPKLLNTETSPWLVWFNAINQQSVGIPTVFKRKPLQYLMALTPEDSKVFNVSYIVSEQNGVPYKDSNGFYKFVKMVASGLNLPGFANYYLDYDGLPQAVQIISEISPQIRTNESFSKYICELNDIQQIQSGIQYAMTNNDGTQIYVDTSSNYIPFFPQYDSYTLSNNIYTKLSNNTVDKYEYTLVKKFDVDITSSYTLVTTVFDTIMLDPFTYNVIPTIHLNKYTEIQTTSQYYPFILPIFLVKEGDYFMFSNTGSYPILFNLSIDTIERRVILYPKQICCFIYSITSKQLQYGFLFLDVFFSTQEKTSTVAKIQPLDTYVFVNQKALYDISNTYIMQTIEPILDSEQNVIAVPNFNESTSTYYEFDDVFETNPIQVTIIPPQIKVVDSITYDSSKYSVTTVSKEFVSYTSPYVCLTDTGNLFLFCDSLGNPTIDIFGYVIPVPSPIHYVNNTYVWYCLDVVKQVSILSYSGLFTIDDTYDFTTQLTSPYSTTLDTVEVYVNSQGYPILASSNAFINVPSSPSSSPFLPQSGGQLAIQPTNIHTQLYLPQDFTVVLVNLTTVEYQIRSQILLAKLKVYTQNTEKLITNYTDLSGNMNNLKDLYGKLLNILNKIQLNSDILALDSYTSDATNIYNEILDSKKNLDIYNENHQLQTINEAELNSVKNTLNNEIHTIQTLSVSIQTNLDNANEQLETLNDRVLSNDYTSLSKTFEKAKSSLEIVKSNIEASADVQYVSEQMNLTKLLLTSFLTIQKNSNALLQSITQRKADINATLLDTKKADLQSLTKAIMNEKDTIDMVGEQLQTYSKSKDTLPFITNIQSSLTSIQTMYNSVKADISSNVVQTAEMIDVQTATYISYIASINQEKDTIQKNTQQLTTLLTNISSQEVVSEKNILLASIQQFEEVHDTINILLNTLILTDEQKQSYETEVLGNYNQVEEMKNSVSEMTDIPTIKMSESRLTELTTLQNTTLNDLQTIELDQQREEPFIGPQPFEGGYYLWETRKKKKKSKRSTNKLVVRK